MKAMRKNIPLFSILSVVFLLAACSKSEKEIQQEIAKKVEYDECRRHWNASDTMRNTALLAVQIQFKKIDKLSLAPKTPDEAIMLLCEPEKKNAPLTIDADTKKLAEEKAKMLD
jgi:hypothetical protein